MDWRTLVRVDELDEALDAPDLVLVDCRFDLRDPGAGRRAYLAGHIPGAVFADLERDLSDPTRSNRGRHPLPDGPAFCARLAQWGITRETQVVVYDTSHGSIAARLWWMLRLLGHERVAVVDGGVSAWVAAGLPLESEVPKPLAGRYSARFNVRAIATTAEVAARMASGNGTLIDARAPERFRGEIEPIDPVAGHVRGAVNRPYAANLKTDGRFKSSARLAREFSELLGTTAPGEVMLMCGSGVTACHNLLAMAHAGIDGARVYAGSWSEWISDPSRPIARHEHG
ncbi:MAG TPA: sulfurtransferase [Xanthomonadaceae bacterium]|nr:sulfurtransferase [Xanthomonadaceae bacterium]